MGEKTFERLCGLLKIPESSNRFDITWVHPENYPLAQALSELLDDAKENFAERLGTTANEV